jgi:hypothetical protein
MESLFLLYNRSDADAGLMTSDGLLSVQPTAAYQLLKKAEVGE